MKRTLAVNALIVLLLACGVVQAQNPQPVGAVPAPAASAVPEVPGVPATPAVPGVPGVQISGLNIRGHIEGENITFDLAFTAETTRENQEIALVTGDVVLVDLAQPAQGARVRLDRTAGTYYLTLAAPGSHAVKLSFAARPALVDCGPWREAAFSIPVAPARQIEVACDRTDLEVLFPEAMRVERKTENGQLVITAVQGSGKPFSVRWKPQVPELAARLVVTSESNSVVTAGAGALRVNTLLIFDVAQGRLSELSFLVPKGLSVTQVRGEFIKDWKVESAAAAATQPDAKDLPEGAAILTVTLNRPQTRQYALQVLAESALPAFPAEVEVPALQPRVGLRASGQVCVGTDSAIQLVVKQTAGLAQIDGTAFARIILDREHPRALPAGKAFFYNYAAAPYQLRVALDDVVPTYDATDWLVLAVREDDLTIDQQIELDVRDAPIRSVVVETPAGYTVAGVAGEQVTDYAVRAAAAGQRPTVEVRFRQPVMGPVVLGLRLEWGKGPLGKTQTIAGPNVVGAKSERGYVAVTAEGGIQFDSAKPGDPQALREVHTASVPMRVPNAQYAYRFRQTPWSLELLASKRAAGILAESFHLLALADGVAYGNVVVNYFITGSPVDELSFHIPAGLENVEFVGHDVRRWSHDDQDPTLWTVKLQRKVLGAYNLAVTYNQRYQDGKEVRIGGIDCAGVATHTGYLVVASHRDLQLTGGGNPDAGLLEIDRDELPANYKLLVTAPVLKTYKFLAAPHAADLAVHTYERGTLVPAVIEVSDLSSQLGVRDDGVVDAQTTVTYKVKNVSDQFLALAMPAGTRQENVSASIQTPQGPRRVAASFDPARHQLLIPLPRKRDPNDPTTIVLTYGQEQPPGQTRAVLVAPQAAVRCTFDNWVVRVPAGWAIVPGGPSNMVPDPRALVHGDLSAPLATAVSCWLRAAGDFWISGLAFGLALAAGLLVLLYFVARPAVPDVLLLLAAGVLLWLGVTAVGQGRLVATAGQTDDLSTLRFTQAVDLTDQAPLTVSVALVPAWRQYVTASSWLVAAAAVAALVLTLVVRRGRRVLLALAVTGLLFTAARFPICELPLIHLLTWVVPAVLLLIALWRVVRRHRPKGWLPRPAQASSAALLLALALLPLLGGCAGQAPIDTRPPLVDHPVLDRVEATLHAEKDSVAVDLALHIDAAQPMRFVVADPSCVLLSPQKISEVLRVSDEGGRSVLQIRQKGVYDVKLQLLAPLPEPGEDQHRGFAIALPTALTNRVHLTIPDTGLDVLAPTAIRLQKQEDQGATTVDAILGPGDAAQFSWKPRARETRLEKTVFYTEVASAIRFDTGLVESRSLIRFQIAQGELDVLHVTIPPNMTVTAVEGQFLGAWRFDPSKHDLEARLAHPVSGEYALRVVTQMATDKTPYTAVVGTPTVAGAQRQRGVLGLLTSAAVYVVPAAGPQTMNVDDFARDAAALLTNGSDYAAPAVQRAYRIQGSDQPLSVQAFEVKPELRTTENAVFTVADDKLVYNADLTIEVTKAGVFGVDLVLPKDYDIDALAGPEVSHWDDNTDAGERTVSVHFRRRFTGTTALKLTLSRSVSELPPKLSAPRVMVAGAVKHLGQILVTSDRGVRLSVASRDGVSELSPLELGQHAGQGALAFRILRPDWSLDLQTEVIEPRIDVDFLHTALVSEGSVRHTVYLRYHIFNAGAKVFEVQVPVSALGLQIAGPDIARKTELQPGSGHYRIELAGKWSEEQYPMTVKYETQFDRTAGKLELAGVQALGGGQMLRRGYLAVFSGERVELAKLAVEPALQPTDPRSIPRTFGAGDLAGAAYCFATSAADYHPTFRATRHESAALLDAQVSHVVLATVATERGQTITRVQMSLKVGSRRHLQAILPPNAQVWSLSVDGQTTVPSLIPGPTPGSSPGHDCVLINLAEATQGEMEVLVELVYVAPGPPAWDQTVSLEGPQFDLPLNDVRWFLFLPADYRYADFGGTLTINQDTVKHELVQAYDTGVYEAELTRLNAANTSRARTLQNVANQMALTGNNTGARQYFNGAVNYSQSDSNLNEDARVQLSNLTKTQALVGLVQSRNSLRVLANAPAQPGSSGGSWGGGGEDLGDRFNADQAQKITASLSADDADNLKAITNKVVDQQEQAAGGEVRLTINMPLRGRVLTFERAHQVERNEPMQVTMNVQPVSVGSRWQAWGLPAMVLAALALLFYLAPALARRWSAVRNLFPARPARAPASQAPVSQTPDTAADMGPDQEEQV